MLNTRFGLWSLVTCVSLIVGCSRGDKWTKNLPDTVPAEGVVLLDGEPVEGASIVFAPEDPKQYPANALTSRSGRFELQAFPSKTGAVPGSYQIGVSKTVEVDNSKGRRRNWGEDAAHAKEAEESGAMVSWQNVLPQQYANPTMSGLTAQIPPEGVEDLKIEISSK